MKVIDVSYSDIELFALKLIEKYSGSLKTVENVLVVGVASGGVPIAKAVFDKINKINVKYIALKCQRPSTKRKDTGIIGKLISSILKVLPKLLLNKLRVLEHNILSRNSSSGREVFELDHIDYNQFDFIFIIDDAVDSGYSLKSVREFVCSQSERPKVITSVYVTTQLEPVYKADFSFKQNVLVRFPWSKDAK
jgi:hypoxanthine phosphoribosyltransferase